jgi:hypothetical protein
VQLWYYHLHVNTGQPPWPWIIQLVNKRFGPPLTDNLIGELALLLCEGLVDDFAKCFMALFYLDTAMTSHYA